MKRSKVEFSAALVEVSAVLLQDFTSLNITMLLTKTREGKYSCATAASEH